MKNFIEIHSAEGSLLLINLRYLVSLSWDGDEDDDCAIYFDIDRSDQGDGREVHMMDFKTKEERSKFLEEIKESL